MIHIKRAIAAGALLTSAIAIAATINGTAGNDSMLGTNVGDEMRGYDGHDRLFGDGGNDTIFGGSGNDILNGGSGTNRLVGGEGADWFQTAGATLTYIDDVEGSELVAISCAASWGGAPADGYEMGRFSKTDSSPYLVFRGRDGTTIRFTGLLKRGSVQDSSTASRINIQGTSGPGCPP